MRGVSACLHCEIGPTPIRRVSRTVDGSAAAETATLFTIPLGRPGVGARRRAAGLRLLPLLPLFGLTLATAQVPAPTGSLFVKRGSDVSSTAPTAPACDHIARYFSLDPGVGGVGNDLVEACIGTGGPFGTPQVTVQASAPAQGFDLGTASASFTYAISVVGPALPGVGLVPIVFTSQVHARLGVWEGAHGSASASVSVSGTKASPTAPFATVADSAFVAGTRGFDSSGASTTHLAWTTVGSSILVSLKASAGSPAFIGPRILYNDQGVALAEADPLFSLDQSTWDSYAAAYGLPTLTLADQFSFVSSPGIVVSAVPEPVAALLMLAGLVGWRLRRLLPYGVSALMG